MLNHGCPEKLGKFAIRKMSDPNDKKYVKIRTLESSFYDNICDKEDTEVPGWQSMRRNPKEVYDETL